eukprot:6193060-Pleurochrysis_carterae.AAC.1
MELFRGGSSFAQREIFDPANVMHVNPDGYSQSNPASEEVISCLKDGEIDLGVRQYQHFEYDFYRPETLTRVMGTQMAHSQFLHLLCTYNTSEI